MYQYPPQPPQPVEDAEKKNMKRLIRREGTRWGLTTVISNLAVSVISIILSVILANLPYGVSVFINGDMGQLLQQIVFSVLIFTVPYIIVARMGKQQVSQLINIEWRQPGQSVPLIMVALGAAMVINVLVSQFIQLVESNGIDTTPPTLEMPDSTLGAVVYVITLTLVPAIVEEFAFRGIILGSMKKYGTAYAVIASSVLFGLMHGNIVQIPFATALGLVMAYVAVATDSIIPAVIIHFLNNLVAAVQAVTEAYCPQWISGVITYGCFLLYLALGIIGFVMLCKRYRHPFDNIKEKGALTVAESTVAAVFSGGGITALIYFGGSACLLLLVNSMSGL